MSIDTLKAVISSHTGLQVANRFTYRSVARGITGESDEYTVLSTSIPGRTVATGEHNPGTVTKKYAYSFIDEDVTVVFRLTNDFAVYDKWIKWMNEVVDEKTYKAGFKNDYQADSTIQTFNVKNNVTKTFTLENSYPIVLSPIELSNESENTIATFAVTLTYDYFTTS